MSAALETQSHIVVADRRPHDYRDLAELASRHSWHVHLLTSGQATLRLAHSTRADLWMLNVQLPDMSGFDLFDMLHSHFMAERIFLIDDQYDPDRERHACGCGAALYLSKDPRGSIDCSKLFNFLVSPRPPPAREGLAISIADRTSHLVPNI
jgi:DNA-binding NtrC family response regulator